jgi:L-threonylcarbamoyladenylate synthase
MRELLKACDFPLAAPSANRSGFVSPTTAEHVLSTLDGRIDAVLDGGACEQGVESTILAVSEGEAPICLRPGPISEPHWQSVDGEASAITAPGQLASHYSPGKPVRLNAAAAQHGEFHIGFGEIAGDRSLSPSGDLGEAAAHLYDCLHQAASSGAGRIAIAPIPDVELGRAINDRLRRAATPA